jgi:hypothetical protein
MKTSVISLRIAGIICLLFVLFHFAFYKIFNWENALNCISHSDRSIMLTYHYISILILSFMSIVSLFQSKQIIESKIKVSVLLLFSCFYLIRIITEFSLFGYKGLPSVVILIMCLIPLVLFSIPIFLTSKHN